MPRRLRVPALRRVLPIRVAAAGGGRRRGGDRRGRVARPAADRGRRGATGSTSRRARRRRRPGPCGRSGGGCVFHTPVATRHGAAAGGRCTCAVHTALGHAALPASCQHFPRVCLIDDRGVRVSLSHYCPTAAAMIVDDDRPVTIVDGPPAVPGRAVPEGLDVRGQLPPRLTERVLTDLDGLTAWERHVVAALAGPASVRTRRSARGAVAADARRLAALAPASAMSLADAVAALAADRAPPMPSPRPRAGLAEPGPGRRGSRSPPRTCRAPWLADGSARRPGRTRRALSSVPVWAAARRRRAPLPGGQGLRRVDHLPGRCRGVARGLADAVPWRCCASSAPEPAAPRHARSTATCWCRRSGSPTCCCATTRTAWRSRGRLAIAERLGLAARAGHAVARQRRTVTCYRHGAVERRASVPSR